LSALCLSKTVADVQFSQLIEETKWLSHVRLILAASWEAAFWIHVHRMPVFLHCSHGWDRTGQVAVLAQLLLDPFYRTREGFATLVEKDFMSFGHPFHTRCAHGEGRGDRAESAGGGSDDGQISPIFLQFLDCAYQLVRQYPECFEFNTKYLLLLSEHVYSCRFGTMLCDTEREREVIAGIRQRTHSLWDYLEEREDCVNKRFTNSGGVLLMPLPSLLRNVTLWADRHCMHGPKETLRSLPSYLIRPSEPNPHDQQAEMRTTEEVYDLSVAFYQSK
jgi:myotubularin-related protein 1/2